MHRRRAPTTSKQRARVGDHVARPTATPAEEAGAASSVNKAAAVTRHDGGVTTPTRSAIRLSSRRCERGHRRSRRLQVRCGAPLRSSAGFRPIASRDPAHALINRYYDPGTGQFLSVDPLVDETDQAYGYTGGDPVVGTDPNGDCVEVLWTCVGGGARTSSIGVGFNPGAGANAIVNIGRGASFGLSNTVANWISPGATCTVPTNSLDELLGGAATTVIGGEALTGLGRLGALRMTYGLDAGLGDLGSTDALGNITIRDGLDEQTLRQTLLHEAVHSGYTRLVGTIISQATYSTAAGMVLEEWAAEAFATGQPIMALRFALEYLH